MNGSLPRRAIAVVLAWACSAAPPPIAPNPLVAAEENAVSAEENTGAANDSANANRFDYREKTLANGLRVVTLEDFSCPIVAVQVWYHVGSKDEAKDRNGFAHMFEHMMFRGTDRLGPTDHFDLVRKTGGSCNAYTAFDNTTYVNVAPSNQLELLLWLEAERMAALKIDEVGFETERRVVEEERRMGLNQPYGSVLERVLPRVFPDHPYSWSPIGTIPHLRAAKIDELQTFWDRFYVPGNATLVIAGAVEHEEARELVARHFDWIPACPTPPRVADPDFPDDGPIEIRLKEKKGPVPVVGIGYRTVPLRHPDSPALDILAHILGSGESSRLHRELVTRKKVAAMALGGMMQLEHAGILAAGAALPPFGRAKKAVAALEAEIARIRQDGVTERELFKAKNALYKSLVESRLRIESKADVLGRAATLLGSTDEVNRSLERFRAVTVDDVHRVAQEYLVPKRRATLVVKPTLIGMISTLLGAARKGKSDEEAADQASSEATSKSGGRRAVARGPKAAAQRPTSLPEKPPIAAPLDTLPPIVKHAKTLDNGLEIVVVPNDDVPFVSLRLGFHYGACHENPDKPGAAAMACAMLTKGTARRGAEEIAEDLETHAIDLAGAAGHDTSVVWATAVTEYFAKTLDSLAEVVREPTFPDDELQTRIRMATTGKMVEEKEPSFLAARQFDRTVYGGHPYARTADGTADDVKRLVAADLRAWWNRFARPDAAVLYVAGAVAPQQTFDLAAKAFGDWRPESPDKPVVELPEFPTRAPMRIHLVDHPGAVQSQIRIGHISRLGHGSEEYSSAAVLNQVFGGSFGARLNSVVRVEKGLTYGISGSFSANKQAGEFQVATFTQTAKTAEAVRVILGEIERMRTAAPSAEEMDSARSYLAGSAARRRETPQAMAEELWSIEYLGLSEGFYEKHLARVAASKSSEVVDVARKHIHPDTLAIVIVGEAKAIRADLETIAPVSVVGK